jgi:hypothetical protein
MEIYTIGFTQTTAERFFGRLKMAGVQRLMLGLARAFQRSDDDCERHWLQVNGICMADRPLAEQP